MLFETYLFYLTVKLVSNHLVSFSSSILHSMIHISIEGTLLLIHKFRDQAPNEQLSQRVCTCTHHCRQRASDQDANTAFMLARELSVKKSDYKRTRNFGQYWESMEEWAGMCVGCLVISGLKSMMALSKEHIQCAFVKHDNSLKVRLVAVLQLSPNPCFKQAS
jgi:hypothetical protein